MAEAGNDIITAHEVCKHKFEVIKFKVSGIFDFGEASSLV